MSEKYYVVKLYNSHAEKSVGFRRHMNSGSDNALLDVVVLLC
jgi:hypothetical protein